LKEKERSLPRQRIHSRHFSLLDLAFANALKDAGIKADAVAGFSLGEIPALAYAGVLSIEDAFKLVVIRGTKMGELSTKYAGGMAAALKLAPEVVEETCKEFKEIWPVNYNCPGQISCAGSADEIDAFCAAIKEKGGRAVKLAVSGAFHTPYMKEASEELEKALKVMTINAPQTECICQQNRKALSTGYSTDYRNNSTSGFFKCKV